MSDVSVAAWRAEALTRLTQAHISPDEAREELTRLLEDLAQLSRLTQLTHPERSLTQTQRSALDRALERRASREPLSHILGRWGFWGLELEVNQHTLTPRPDTEVLVEEALAWLHAHPSPPKTAQDTPHLVIDVCTGTGCVGLALLSELPLKLLMTELSREALKVAERNTSRLSQQGLLKATPTLLQGDLLSPIKALNQQPSLIVSNPPYIPRAELAELMPEVRDYEPHLALEGGGELGLELPLRLLKEAVALLASGGALMMEVGWNQTEEVASAFTLAGLHHVRVRHDYGGQPRVVIGEKR